MMRNKRSRSTYEGMNYSAKTVKDQYNPYKEALLNPISGPLVGIPVSVPVDTHRARLKAVQTVTVTGGSLTILSNPVFSLCNDAIPDVAATVGVGAGAFNWVASTSLLSPSSTLAATSNAQYTRAQFAGRTTASSVRARIVGACLRICNVSAANTRNGVFTLFHEPQHTTLQFKTAAQIATDPKARQYNASVADWHTVTYHPVESDEVDAWVWDPAVGPQAGIKSGAYVTGANDGTPADSMPGYMGIWWNGDAVSQTFQIEYYCIAEYVGALVQPLVRDIETDPSMMNDAHVAAEAATTHIASPTEAQAHTGHPNSDTHPTRAARLLDFGREHANALKQVGKIAAVGVSGLMGGPAAAQTVAELLYTEQQLGKAQATARRYNELQGQRTPGTMSSGARIPNPRLTGSSYTTPTSYQSPASASRNSYLGSRGRGARGRR